MKRALTPRGRARIPTVRGARRPARTRLARTATARLPRRKQGRGGATAAAVTALALLAWLFWPAPSPPAIPPVPPAAAAPPPAAAPRAAQKPAVRPRSPALPKPPVGIEEGRVRAAILARAGDLRACAVPAGVPSQVPVRLRVPPSGEVRSVQFAASEPLPPELVSCLRERLLRWRFDDLQLTSGVDLFATFALR
jgi:hypothetical protein